MQSRLQMCYNNLNVLAPQRALAAQKAALEGRAKDLLDVAEAVKSANITQMRQKDLALRTAAAMAESLSPYGVLARGYTIVRDKSGHCRSVGQLKSGQCITIQGADAAASCTVNQVDSFSPEETS